MSKRLSISQRLGKAGSLGTQREILHDWADKAQADLVSEDNPHRRQVAADKFFGGLHSIIERIIDLDDGNPVCERCGFRGKFIDEGETCPKCKLVQ